MRRSKSRPDASDRGAATLDVALLSGFRFQCRPDCGLCCYASPAVTVVEQRRLLQIEPEAPMDPGDGGYRFIAPQGEGGACHFLSANRCRVHALRPFPCAEYPLLVHVGSRPQATLVLTCPGLDLSALDGYAGGPAPEGPPLGLKSELAMVHLEMGRSPVGEWIGEGMRLDRVLRKRWSPSLEATESIERRLAAAMSRSVPDPGSLVPPPRSDGLDSLPLLFDPGLGRVGLASGTDGLELWRLRESGGDVGEVGSYPVPQGEPALDEAGARRLRGYLGYCLRRDSLTWQRFAAGPRGTGTLEDDLLRDLAELRAAVLIRGSAISMATGGGVATFGVTEIDRGIRATDADWLDRRTVGRIL
jgi:Fe-S-cluster containining protein